tara:strand:+ start:1787 stop:2392 length:606 start_codon:yes stop_codon:yes gene_type:complete
MIDRKKKLRVIQTVLLSLGLLIIFFTYVQNQKDQNNEIVSLEVQKKIKQQIESSTDKTDSFYNIEYTGLDLSGNRYILKSEEASSNRENQEIVNMKFVEAIFYFKDDTLLKVKSDTGIYNNKTLDMNFYGNVIASYQGSQLLAQKAEYSNSNSYLIISEKVKIKDKRGTMVADKLLFDIKKQTLNIASNKNSKINADINIK